MKISKKHSTVFVCRRYVFCEDQTFFSLLIVDTVSACVSKSLEIQNKGQYIATKVYVSHLINCCCYEDLLQSVFKWFKINSFFSSHNLIPFAIFFKCVCVCVRLVLTTHFIGHIDRSIITISIVHMFPKNSKSYRNIVMYQQKHLENSIKLQWWENEVNRNRCDMRLEETNSMNNKKKLIVWDRYDGCHALSSIC